VVSELGPELDPSITRRFGTVADDATVKRSTAALEANGITVLRAANAAAVRDGSGGGACGALAQAVRTASSAASTPCAWLEPRRRRDILLLGHDVELEIVEVVT